jgi:hypothetical protein
MTSDYAAEYGPNEHFQMYTREGNDACAKLTQDLVTRAEEGRWRRAEVVTWLKNGMAILGLSHPEVHDTEPEWAIVDEVNVWLKQQGFLPVDRDDLF